MTMAKLNPLAFGIFWIISDCVELDEYKLLVFNVPCDQNGNALETPPIQLNSKSGTSYNHKAMWYGHVKGNTEHKAYNKQTFNHYPRGRVEISKGRAIVYLNPIISHSPILDEIKMAFGLSEDSISSIRVVVDNSAHYSCFIG